MKKRSSRAVPQKNPRTTIAILALVLVALVWIVFGRTLAFPFVNYDDNTYVYDNPQITRGLSLDGLRFAFTQVHSDNWHPLTTLTHMLDCTLFGLNAGGHHFVNVLLHSAAVVLCFLVCWQMTGAIWRSAVVAAVFAIHPLRVESVAWISERKDVLSGFFFMLTLAAYLAFVRKHSLGRYLSVVACFCAGLLSKQMLVTLPVILLLIDYWPLGRMKSRDAIVRLIVEKLPLFALSIAAGITTLLVQRRAAELAARLHLGIADRLANAAVSIVIYLRQTFWPTRLVAFYPHPGTTLPWWQIALAVLVIVIISALACFFARSRPYLFVGWTWFIVMLLPVLGIIQVGEQAHADRYTYLPHVGLLLALTWLICDLANARITRLVLRPLAIGIVVVLTFAACHQVSFWQNSETLWRHALAITTNNFVAEHDLAEVLLKSGRMQEAITHLEKMLAVQPDHARAQNNLAVALIQTGRPQEAIVHWRKSLELQPDNPEARDNFAIALLYNRQPEEAIANWEISLQQHSDDIRALVSLGWVLATYADDAVRDGNRALEFAEKADQVTQGRNPVVARLGAAAFAEVGQFDAAIETANVARAAAVAQKNDALVRALEGDLARYQIHQPLRTRELIPFH